MGVAWEMNTAGTAIALILLESQDRTFISIVRTSDHPLPTMAAFETSPVASNDTSLCVAAD